MVDTTQRPAFGAGGKRRSMVALAGTLMAVFILNSLIGLFAMHLDREAAAADDERLHRLVHALDVAREAQVAFKIQVQEWKNTLLRGGAPADFTRYFASFEAQERRVAGNLQALAGMAAFLGLDARAVEEAQSAHRTLGARYREALARYDGADAASASAVDALVRGIDRPLDQSIDALADSARGRLDAVQTEIDRAAAERTATLRTVTIASMLAGLALIGVILVRAGGRRG
jgi:hypothetical protein